MGVHRVQAPIAAPQIERMAKQYRKSAEITRVSETRSAPSADFAAREVRAIGFDQSGLNARQLREVAALGFDAVIVECRWGYVQNANRKWNWDRYKKYCDDAHNAGLKIIFRGPIHAPEWMDDRHCFRDWQGTSSFHGLTGRVLSFWDVEAQRLIDEFLYQAKTQLPWGEFWAIELNIGQGGEVSTTGPRFHEDGSHDEYTPLWCFDPHALTAYRMAMRIKYQDDLNAYNARHGLKLSSWDEALPARDWNEARFDGDTTAWYQAELLRYIESMVHRVQPHRRVVLAHAPNFTVRPEYWGAGSFGIEAALYDIGRHFEKQFIEMIHLHYALLHFHEAGQFLIMQHLSQRKWYAGCQYVDGAEKNLPLLKRMGAQGFVCGVNDYLFDFKDGRPDRMIPEQSAKIARAINAS